jgi:hypothetical protein
MKFTKVSCLALAALLSCLAARDASAQVVDIAKISCKQFLLGNIVRRDYLALWLSGYYNGTHNDPIIETSTVQNIANKVGNYCHANLDDTLMDAIQKALGLEK